MSRPSIPISSTLRPVGRLVLFSLLFSCKETTGPDPDVVDKVTVTVPRPMVRVGEVIQATAVVANGSSQPISGKTVIWSSSNPAIANVDQNGKVTALAAGDVTLQATADDVSGTAALKVTIVPVTSVTVSAPTSSITVGQIIALAAVAKDSAGNGLSGRTITWSSNNESRAVVSTSGVVTALAAGGVDITATSEGKSATIHLDVGAQPQVAVANVQVTLPRAAFRVGETLQAAALPLDASGGVLTGRTISWSTSDPSVATVTPSGMVTAVGPGTATISAEVEGKTGSIVVQLSLVPVASISITPPSETVSAGATVAFSVVLKDSANRTITGRPVAWESNNPAVASVNSSGVVTGMLVGTAAIFATVEGKTAQANVTVNTVNTPVATVTVTPANSNVSGGGTKQMHATLRDANGNVLNRDVTWTSSNPAIASVSSSGVVTAIVTDAQVTITATAEGKSASTTLGIVTFVKMSAGFGNCALQQDGTPWCWSFNAPDPVKVSTNLKFVTISTGYDFTCGIAQDGLTYCWGQNYSGQLGNGTTSPRSDTPVLVSGNFTFLSVAAGRNTTCGTTPQAEVYCWGDITYRDDLPPDGHTREVAQPVPLFVGSGMVAVVGGLGNQFCSVDSTGLAYCWKPRFFEDRNHFVFGPIGDPISTTLHFTTVRVGFDHFCGLDSSGKDWCWGTNSFGQIGDGTTQDRAAPTPVTGGLTFQSIAAGGGSLSLADPTSLPFTYSSAGSCGLTSNGTAYCWGSNVAGEAGVGTTASFITSPQPVAGGLTWTGLRAGLAHVCGLATNGVAYCWGVVSSTKEGGLSSRVPVPVFGP